MTDIHKKISEEAIACDMLERYTGSNIQEFQPYLLLTNFAYYVDVFAEIYQVPVSRGSMFSAAHALQARTSIIDFKLGSPGAALTVDLCSFLPNALAAVMLGMCGGLRSHYQVGDYFVPVASIRKDGTSDAYFPPEVPALANFVVQKTITNILEAKSLPYHIGITHTTNIRFWEFNKEFRRKLYENKAQTVEMECATLFAAGYRRNLPLGALLLISDLPLRRDGIKTKKSSSAILANHTKEHILTGVEVFATLQEKVGPGIKKTKGLPHMEFGQADDSLSEQTGVSDRDF